MVPVCFVTNVQQCNGRHLQADQSNVSYQHQESRLAQFPSPLARFHDYTLVRNHVNRDQIWLATNETSILFDCT